MKRLTTHSLIIPLFLMTSYLCYSQENKKGVVTKNAKQRITSVQFRSLEESERPSSSQEFLKSYLEISSNDQFKKIPHTSKRANFVHEHYDQYYKGMKVDGGGYNFHYENGTMYFANGNFVKIDNINTIPSISKEEAIQFFLDHKSIAKEKVASNITDLFIKEFELISSDGDTATSVHLTYSI